MMRRSHILFGVFLLLAIGLTFFKIPLASSQGLSLVAKAVEGDLPLSDPSSELWGQATAIQVPLSAQMVAKPFLLESKVKSVAARALHNGSDLAFLVTWSDDTQDEGTLAVQDFRDAVALQFPLVAGQPYFCMGQQGGDVNIWHWKADWQAEIAARQEMEDKYPDMYVDYYPFAQAEGEGLARAADYSDPNYLPALQAGNLFASLEHASPVEDLVAGGFGSLTAQPAEGQQVQGYGAWADGQWQVIFSRALEATEAGDAAFAPGKSYSIAFAVWDGANEERNGQKSTSQWITLQLEGAASKPPAAPPEGAEAAPTGWATTQNLTMLVYAFFAVVVLAGALIYARLKD